MKKPTFRVGQIVVHETSHGGMTFHRIAAIDADGTLYEGFMGHFITKISDVRPLTAKEKGSSR
jgi:hypothetical protein